MSILTFEVVESFTLKRDGQVTTCSPGQRLKLPHDKAQRVLEQVGGKVRLVQDEPPATKSIEKHANDGYVPMPGAWVRWKRGDDSQAAGIVDQVIVDPHVTPPINVFVALHTGGWAAVNPCVIRMEVVGERSQRS